MQIIQNNIINISEKTASYILSQNALNMRIKYIKRTTMPPQPKTLNEIDVLVSLYYTLSETLFLVKDTIVNQKRILLFTTTVNIQYLSQVLF